MKISGSSENLKNSMVLKFNECARYREVEEQRLLESCE